MSPHITEPEEGVMADSKHTPGPWTWWTSNSWRRLKHDERGQSYNVLEPFVARDGHPDLLVSVEDMKLIAAAPELLAALEKTDLFLDHMQASFDVCEHTQAMIDQVKAAIAKAKGQSL